jgi:transposase
LFLIDGRIEMGRNAVERTIRPMALQRKNALFAGHHAGAYGTQEIFNIGGSL